MNYISFRIILQGICLHEIVDKKNDGTIFCTVQTPICGTKNSSATLLSPVPCRNEKVVVVFDRIKRLMWSHLKYKILLSQC